jgi:hypothetical protein
MIILTAILQSSFLYEKRYYSATPPAGSRAGKTQSHKGNINISILHSYLQEKNAWQEKSKGIIFNNLGI